MELVVRFVAELDLALVLVVKHVDLGMVDTFVVVDMDFADIGFHGIAELRMDFVDTEFHELVGLSIDFAGMSFREIAELRMDFVGMSFREIAELRMDFVGIVFHEFVVLRMNFVDVQIPVVVVLGLQAAALDIVVLDFEDSMVVAGKDVDCYRTFYFLLQILHDYACKIVYGQTRKYVMKK